MKCQFVGSGFAFAIALTASVAAQNPPQPQPPQSPPASAAPADPTPALAQAGTVTVEGCVSREADVPGRRPPEDIRSTVISANNYVLTSTAMIAGSGPADARGPLLYKIQGIKKPELKEHIGRRVQIDGTFDKVGRAKNPVLFSVDLVELKGTAIRPVAGDCTGK